MGRRIYDETGDTQVKSFGNRRGPIISEEVNKRQDKQSEEFRIARKEINSYMGARNNRREIRRRSNDETSGKELESLDIKRINMRVADESKKAQTIQDEHTDEIQQARIYRRAEEENRNDRREIGKVDGDHITQIIDRIVEYRLSKQA